MGRPRVSSAALLLVTIGCDTISGPLPQPPTPVSRMVTDAGFPIKPRPPCSAIVVAALDAPEPGAIARAAGQGAQFTCGEPEYSLPLDQAVLSGSLERVRALLEAGAD